MLCIQFKCKGLRLSLEIFLAERLEDPSISNNKADKNGGRSFYQWVITAKKADHYVALPRADYFDNSVER